MHSVKICVMPSLVIRLMMMVSLDHASLFTARAPIISLDTRFQLLTNDYFLSSIRDEFLDNARYFMFESYCRIHKRISIPSLSQKLALPPAEGERWIVNLVRNARIDAKVDAEQGQVQMGTTFTPIYQEVIEKAKELAFRSQVVSSNVEKKEVELRAKKEQLAKEKETAANATVKA